MKKNLAKVILASNLLFILGTLFTNSNEDLATFMYMIEGIVWLFIGNALALITVIEKEEEYE